MSFLLKKTEMEVCEAVGGGDLLQDDETRSSKVSAEICGEQRNDIYAK